VRLSILASRSKYGVLLDGYMLMLEKWNKVQLSFVKLSLALKLFVKHVQLQQLSFIKLVKLVSISPFFEVAKKVLHE
jgi:hypothetical protein